MSMQGRKNLQERIKSSAMKCKKDGAKVLAGLIIGEHEAHKLLRKKPIKFPFNQMNISSENK